MAFNARIQAPDACDEFDRIVNKVLADAPREEWTPGRESASAALPVDWSSWLQRYRLCLDALRERFGLPGDVYRTAGGETVTGA
jgi:hypothetical protein